MNQLAIAWDAAHVGAERWAKKLAWLRRAVDVLGHKEVAFTLDIKPSNLTDALLERERKDVKARWFEVVLAMDLPDEMIAEYLRIENQALGYETPKRIRNKTSAEELREMREALQRLAPGVLTLVDKELGK